MALELGEDWVVDLDWRGNTRRALVSCSTIVHAFALAYTFLMLREQARCSLRRGGAIPSGLKEIA